MAKSKTRKKKRGIVKKIFITLFVLFMFALFFIGGLSYTIIKNAPEIDPEGIYALLSESSYMYDTNGNLYERLQSEKYRTNIKYTQMPKDLVNAFVAIEDKTFWEHKGFNVVRLFGAVIQGIKTGERIGGTSTITQQLARNLYLSEIKSERTLSRKLVEGYYTVLLERSLRKEEILEAYLNTIYLGYSANGVEAAAHAYFNKGVGDLTIAECSLLATITKNPSKLAPVKRLLTSDVDPADPNIIVSGKIYTTLYNDNFKDRQSLVLSEMYDLAYITSREYHEALEEDIRSALSSESEVAQASSSYFSDYVIDSVASEISKKLDIDEKSAYNMLYNSGLKIYSTVDPVIQQIVETEFQQSDNFPSIVNLNKDAHGNILTADKEQKDRKIMLYKYDTLIDTYGNLILPATDYELSSEGELKLLRGHYLEFRTLKENESIKDITINIKDMYVEAGGNKFYYYGDSVLQIPAEDKTLDAQENVMVSKEFLKAHPDMLKPLENGSLVIDSSLCKISEGILQPQAAMAIMDHHTGELKALVGGRDSDNGKMLFNRATAPHPPGSSIKPLAVYLPALLEGYTASSMIDDSQLTFNGKIWPKNYDNKYRGPVTLRTAVEASINVPAVKVSIAVSAKKSAEFLKKIGVTSVVESGNINDINPAAMALGGMTFGISPLEMTGAYGSIADNGVYQKPIAYTKVLTKSGDVLLKSPAHYEEVFDQGSAFIIGDILRSAVSEGTGTYARIFPDNGTIPVHGKTGTTSNNYNLWFCGYTPYYTGGLWIGNDINLQLDSSSKISAMMWSRIMTKIHTGLPAKTFSMPDTVTEKAIDTRSGKLASSGSFASGKARKEYFIVGTEPTTYDSSVSSAPDTPKPSNAAVEAAEPEDDTGLNNPVVSTSGGVSP